MHAQQIARYFWRRATDGTFVCMCHWATAELQRQHIAATTFGPPGRAAL